MCDCSIVLHILYHLPVSCGRTQDACLVVYIHTLRITSARRYCDPLCLLVGWFVRLLVFVCLFVRLATVCTWRRKCGRWAALCMPDGGIFNDRFIANFQEIVTVEEFRKSGSIWWSYFDMFRGGGCFFQTQCISNAAASEHCYVKCH